MALSGLDLRQPDLGALNYVAGKSGQLNLPNTGALGLQAMQTEFNQENQQRQQALQQMQIQQQGQLGLGQQNIQQQQLQQQAANQQRQGLLAQQQQGFQNQMAQQQQTQQAGQQQTAQQQQSFQNQIAQQQADQQAQQQHFTQVAAMSKNDLQQKGAFASYALMSLQGAKSPDEAKQIGQSIYKEAVDKNYLTQDQANQLSQLPLSQQQNAMKAMVISMGQTKAFKDMQDDQTAAPTKGAPITNPDGSISVPLTAAEQTATQKQIAVQDKMLNQLKELQQTFKPDYFTFGGKATKWLAEQESKSNNSPLMAPISEVGNILSGQSPEQRQQFLNDASQYNHSAGQIFQQYIQSIAGSRPSAERVKQLETLFANGSMSPTEYQAGLAQLLRDIQNERDQAANMLNKGVNTTPPVDPNEGRRRYLSSLKNPDGSPRWSSDQIENFLKSYKQ